MMLKHHACAQKRASRLGALAGNSSGLPALPARFARGNGVINRRTEPPYYTRRGPG